MNRKKILLCLNSNDNGRVEHYFVEQNLQHPQNLVINLCLDCLTICAPQTSKVSVDKDLISQAASIQDNESIERLPEQSPALNPLPRRHTYQLASIKELLKESQFADVIVIKSSTFLADCTYYRQEKPLKEILSKSGCPVIVIPDSPSSIEHVVMVCTDPGATLRAVKSLRTNMSNLSRFTPLTIVLPTDGNGGRSSEDEKLLIEYLRIHFKDLGIHKVCEDSVHTLHYAVDQEQNIMVVTGSSKTTLPEYLARELENLTQSYQHDMFRFFNHWFG